MHLDRGREQTFIGIEASAGALAFQVHRHASAILIAEMTLQYIDTVRNNIVHDIYIHFSLCVILGMPSFFVLRRVKGDICVFNGFG